MVIDTNNPGALYDYFMLTPAMQEQKALDPSARNSVYNMLNKIKSAELSKQQRADTMLKFMLNEHLRGQNEPPADFKLSIPDINKMERANNVRLRFGKEVLDNKDIYNDRDEEENDEDKKEKDPIDRAEENDTLAYTPESTDLLDNNGRVTRAIYVPTELGTKLFDSISKEEFPDPADWNHWIADKLNVLKTGKHIAPEHDVTEPYFETEKGKVYANPKPGYINNRSDLTADVEVALPKEARGNGAPGEGRLPQESTILPKFSNELPDVDTDFEIPDDFKAEMNSHPIEPTSPKYKSAMRQFGRGKVLYAEYLKTGEFPKDKRDAYIFDKYTDMLGYGMQHADYVINKHIRKLEKDYVDPSRSPQQRGQTKKDLLWFYLLQDKDNLRAGIKFPSAPPPTLVYDNFVNNYLSNKIRKKYLGDEKSVYSSKTSDKYRDWESSLDKLHQLKQVLIDAKELGTMTPEAYNRILAEYRRSKTELKRKFVEAKEKGLDKALASAGKNK